MLTFLFLVSLSLRLKKTVAALKQRQEQVVEEKRNVEKMWELAEEKMTSDDQHKRTSEASQRQAMEMKIVRMEEQINELLRKWWLVGW